MERKFPDLLKQLHTIEIDYADGKGIDFEPFDSFYSETETSDWVKAWTGNQKLGGEEYLIFGQDGAGGYAAFWCIRETPDLLQQPIAFLGSEGEVGIIASNFYDYLWLFANSIGPYEAVAYPGLARPINKEFLEFAEKHASSNRNTVNGILEKANNEFPNFSNFIEELCQS